MWSTSNSDYGSFYKNTPYNNTYSRLSSYNPLLDRGTYKLNTNKFYKRYDKIPTQLDFAYQQVFGFRGHKRMFSFQNNNSNGLSYILNSNLRRIPTALLNKPKIKRSSDNSGTYTFNNDKISMRFNMKSFNDNNSNNVSSILQPSLYRIPEISSPFNTKSKMVNQKQNLH